MLWKQDKLQTIRLEHKGINKNLKKDKINYCNISKR